MLIQARATHREFVKVRLAGNERAGIEQALYDERVVFRVVMFECRGSSGAGKARYVDIVFDQDRHAMQRSDFASSRSSTVRAAGRIEQRIRILMDQRSECFEASKTFQYFRRNRFGRK